MAVTQDLAHYRFLKGSLAAFTPDSISVEDPVLGRTAVQFAAGFTRFWSGKMVRTIDPSSGDVITVAAFLNDAGSLVAREVYVNIGQFRGHVKDITEDGFTLDPVVSPDGRIDGRGGRVETTAATEVLHASTGGAVTPLQSQDIRKGIYALAIGVQRPSTPGILQASRLIM